MCYREQLDKATILEKQKEDDVSNKNIANCYVSDHQHSRHDI